MRAQSSPGAERKLVLTLLIATFLLGAVLPGWAAAQDGSRQDASFRFLEQRPATPSAMTFEVDYVNPDDPSGKPPAVRTVIEELASGAAIDTSVPAQCTATDVQLMLQGPSACAADAAVGVGTIRLDTGLPAAARFIDADIVFLNNTNELIFVSTERITGARVVTRSQVETGRIANDAPLLPGTPPDGAAIDVVSVQLREISRSVNGQVRGYITTPASCPAGGFWTNLTSFTYADGISQTAATNSPCVPPPAAPSAPTAGTCEKRIVGTEKRDRLSGTAENELIRGLSGNDRIKGGGGNDCLRGNRGADRIDARDGEADRVRCGRGRDKVRADRGDRVGGCEVVQRKR
jgi:hypothetical protein